MSRICAILSAIFLVCLVIVEAMTEQHEPASAFDMSIFVLNVSAQILLVAGLLLYCGFAALHSTQYVTSPRERSTWLILTIGLNVLGSCWYFLTAYQAFRTLGKGRLMSFRKQKDPTA
jgi:hypothetical protein